MYNRKLTRGNFRRIFRRVRSFWNEYDPIGVMDDPEWPRDEYEAYTFGTLKLLNRRASVQDHCDYLEKCHDKMGLEFCRKDAERFAKQLRAWWLNRLDGERKFD